MPASRVQQLIWSRALRNRRSAAWNVAVRFTLRGDLRIAAFRAAVAALVATNEILRTSFLERDGVLSQVIHATTTVPVSVIDLSLLSESEKEKYLEDRSLAEARRPFDLTAAPLMRVTLVRLDMREHVLLLTLHHAICDGWSIGLLSDALMQSYEDELSGHRSSSDGEKLQYADFCVWQDERHATPEYQEHAAYWGDYLSGTDAVDFTANSGSASAGAAIASVVLPGSLTDRISALARQRGVTFAQVVASAFGVLRSFQTKKSTVVFGAPVPGRDAPEMESIIGPFVNYLPVRLECAPSTKVSELLKATSAMFADWLSHSEYRYADILKQFDADRVPFDALLISQQDFVHTVDRGGVQLSALPSVSPGALYGLTFFLVAREDGWRASCEVDTAKYSVAQAQSFIGLYQQILEAFAQDSEQTIEQVIAQLTSPAEHTAHALDETTPPPSLVDFPASEAQARYYLLDRSDPGKSTFHLRIRMAVDSPFQVDLISEAFDLLIRRHEILRTTFVMVDEKLRQRVHEPTLAPSFESLDLSGLNLAEQDEKIRIALLREDDWHFDLGNGPLVRVFVANRGNDQWVLSITLAHLIVDGWSGGVLQREFQELYAGLLRGEHHELPPLPLQYGDYAVSEEQWLQTANVGDRVQFWREHLDGKLAALDLPTDVGLPQTSKANGAVELAPLDASVGASVRQLARDLETTPFVVYGAVFQALLFRYSRETDITFSTPLASRNDETENVIGPFSTPVPLRSKVQPDWSLRQYIQALHNTAMDTFDNPLPFDRYADLIALSTVRGRHALNQLCFFYQKAFVESSEIDGLRFTALPTSVTGAGFEWQLAIIERRNDLITAEFQFDADQYSRATIQSVLRHYERLLSEAMFHLDAPVINIAFATSEELSAATSHPDTLPPVSKRAVGIDNPRKPEAATTASALPEVFPRNEAEKKMAALWERAFRRKPISVHANFFDLGGHSLTLARLQSYCQQQLGKRIYAADLFAAPTIATLTARLETAAADVAFNPRLIPLQPAGSQPPLYLISQSMIFRRVAECLGPDQPVFSVQIEDEDLKGSETFEDFARFYVKIIREARPHGPYRVGGWCAAGWVAYEIAQQLRAAGERVEMLLVVDAWAPGYWRDLPPLRKLVAKTSYYWSRFGFHRRTFAALSSRERKDFIQQRTRLWKAAITRQMGSIPFLRRSPQTATESDTTLVDQVQYAASLKYHARPWPGRALLFCSSEQPFGKFLPRDMGWSRLLTENTAVTILPGDHHKIFEDPGAGIVAATVKSALTGESAPVTAAAKASTSQASEDEDQDGKRSCALAGF